MQNTNLWVWGSFKQNSYASPHLIESDEKLIECFTANHEIWVRNEDKRLFRWNVGSDKDDQKQLEKEETTLITMKTILGSNSRTDYTLLDESGTVYFLGPKARPVPFTPCIGIHIQQIACGSTFTLALTSETHRLLVWGSCLHGELGRGVLKDESDTPLPISSLEGVEVSQIAVGWDHCVVYCEPTDQVYVWGSSRHGKLGLGKVCEDVSTPSEGKLLCCWSSGVKSLSCGYSHTILVDGAGNAFSWGNNDYGQLGHNDTRPRELPTFIEAFDTVPLISAACGAFHSTVVTALQELYVWGWGNFGQLGDGEFKSRSSPVIVQEFVGRDVVDVSCGGQLTVAITRNFVHETTFSDTEMATLAGNECPSTFSVNVDEDFIEDEDLEDPKSPKWSFSFPKKLFNSTLLRNSADSEDLVVRNCHRPDNLPPKDPKELRKHAKEIAEKRKLYSEMLSVLEKTKLGEEKKESYSEELQKRKESFARKNQIKRDSQIRRDELFWNEKAQNWDKYRNSKQVFEKCFKNGIPSMSRCLIWPSAIGNALSITRNLYEVCGSSVQQAKKELVSPSCLFPENSDSSPYFLSLQSLRLISVDLERTFPSLAFFQSESQMYEDLKLILERFCFWRPDLGYVQGMSYLGGNLLLYLEPFDAFVGLCNLLNSRMLYDFMRLKRDSMNSWHSLFDQVLSESFPRLRADLYQVLDREMFEHMCLTEWFLTLYCRPLALDVAGRVWDCYLIQGEVFLFQTAVGLLLAMWPRFRNESLEVVCKVLRNDPFTMAAEELFAHIPSLSRISKSVRRRISSLSQGTPL